MEVKILEALFQSIDIIYIVMCNVCTYAVLQFLQELKVKLDKWQKRATSAATAIVLAVVMVTYFHHNPEAVFYGFFMQFLTWDYFFKPFISMLVGKIDKSDDLK